MTSLLIQSNYNQNFSLLFENKRKTKVKILPKFKIPRETCSTETFIYASKSLKLNTLSYSPVSEQKQKFINVKLFYILLCTLELEKKKKIYRSDM